MGANLRLSLDHTGITERYRAVKVLRRRFDEALWELTEWVQENERELEPPVEEDGLRKQPWQYSRLGERREASGVGEPVGPDP